MVVILDLVDSRMHSLQGDSAQTSTGCVVLCALNGETACAGAIFQRLGEDWEAKGATARDACYKSAAGVRIGLLRPLPVEGRGQKGLLTSVPG